MSGASKRASSTGPAGACRDKSGGPRPFDRAPANLLNARPRLRRHSTTVRNARRRFRFVCHRVRRGRLQSAISNRQSAMDGRRLLHSRVCRTQFDGFHYRRNAQTMRRKQDGMPHSRTSPGRNTGAVGKNRCRERTVSSDPAKTAKQGSADFVSLESAAFSQNEPQSFREIETLRYLAQRGTVAGTATWRQRTHRRNSFSS
jgi:hypothetical protein